MSRSQSIQRLLTQAKEKEKKHDWLGAAELHEEASDRVRRQEDFLKAGDIQERIGYCFYRAAFQAERHEDFTWACVAQAKRFYCLCKSVCVCGQPIDHTRIMVTSHLIYTNFFRDDPNSDIIL